MIRQAKTPALRRRGILKKLYIPYLLTLIFCNRYSRIQIFGILLRNIY